MFDFNKLPSMAEEAVDTTEADEKAERIQFHREKVRNGPVKFSTPTNGQLRRSEKRAGRRALLQRRREQIRTYFSREQQAATLRGQLQALGVLNHEATFSEEQTLRAAKWVVQKFGGPGALLQDHEGALRAAIQAAYDRYADLTGQERSKVEYAA